MSPLLSLSTRAAAAVHVGLVERVVTVYRILVSGGGREVRLLLAKNSQFG